MPNTYRALLTLGNSVTQVKRGPIRDTRPQAQPDLRKLEEHYRPHTGAIYASNQPLFNGETDPIFDEEDLTKKKKDKGI